MFKNNKKIKAKKINQVEDYTLFLVSSKECSTKYLYDKIYSRFENANEYADKVIKKFVEMKYVSDERFCEVYVRSKYNLFYGKMYIKQNLIFKHGIKDKMIDLELENHDFYESAWLYFKKLNIDFSSLEYKDKIKVKSKIARRGFSYDEIDYAINYNHS